jgi:hypothetical protein
LSSAEFAAVQSAVQEEMPSKKKKKKKNGMEWNGMEWNGMECRASCMVNIYLTNYVPKL